MRGNFKDEDDLSFLLVCAFRYAVDRYSYAPGIVARIILDNKKFLTKRDKTIILKSIEALDDTFGDIDRCTWYNVKVALEESL